MGADTPMKVPEYIRQLAPYVPGKPLEELERDLGITKAIKIASNENPFGPSPKAVAAMRRALAQVHRYPDGRGYELKTALSRHLSITPRDIILGNGSNELIELLIKTYMRPGDEAVMGDPSFLVYDLAVRVAGGRSRRVPLRDFEYDLDGFDRAVGPRTRIVFLASPNNPTGTIITRRPLEAFLRRLNGRALCVLDEAYCEFVRDADYPDSLAYIRRCRNLIALRTFSKLYGLAGLRVGYGIADGEIVGWLERVRQPFNVNSLAQAAATAALGDTAHVRRTLENNRSEMVVLTRGLRALGLRTVPSQANFVLINVPPGGKRVYEALLRRGVIVRPMDEYGLPDHIRVTVGLPGENRRFLSALEEVMGRARRRG